MDTHRFLIYAMAAGPEAAPVCEADTATGAGHAIAAQANEGAPGWYVVVDTQARPCEHVATYYAPEGCTVASLWAVPAHRPWVTAARAQAEAQL